MRSRRSRFFFPFPPSAERAAEIAKFTRDAGEIPYPLPSLFLLLPSPWATPCVTCRGCCSREMNVKTWRKDPFFFAFFTSLTSSPQLFARQSGWGNYQEQWRRKLRVLSPSSPLSASYVFSASGFAEAERRGDERIGPGPG